MLTLYTIASGLGGAVIVGPVLDALPGSVLAPWGLGSLLVFAAGALTFALQGPAGRGGRPYLHLRE